MLEEAAVKQEVRDLFSEIVAKYKFDAKSVKYYTVGNAGDGYLSNSVLVTVSNTKKETIKLFAKYALNAQSNNIFQFDNLYSNEIHFYNVIFPTYKKFLAEKHVSDGFRNVPKCYGISLKNIVVLENLKESGYVLYDRGQLMNDAHIEIVLRSLAKYHAISFALKDQDQRKYHQLVEKVHDIFSGQDCEHVHQVRTRAILEFLESLDPEKDKHILDRCHDLPERTIKFIQDTIKINSKYAVLIQGDCWSNNLMFLYEGDKNNPSDVMLIDWQMIRNTLPVYDLAMFFYTVATKETLNKLDYFLKLYHDELSKQIRKLGSDPNMLYPFAVLEQHWKVYAKHGFIIGLLTIRLMLTEKDEVMNFEELDIDNLPGYPQIRNHNEYLRRMKILADHFVRNDFL